MSQSDQQYNFATLPNFLIVGGEKCGTTTLFGYLAQHPDIFLPEIKECKYFSAIDGALLNPFTNETFEQVTRSVGEYLALFDGVTQALRGDASPDYLYFAEKSVPNIIETLGGDTKIIIMLRDPIQRAFSNYLHLIREKLTSLSFDEYLEVEDHFNEETTWWGFYTKRAGLYERSVKLFLKSFSHVKVIFFDDFVSVPRRVVQDVLHFLEVREEVVLSRPAFTNKTGVKRNATLDKLLNREWFGKAALKNVARKGLGSNRFNDSVTRLREWNLRKPEISHQAQIYLREYYSSDVAELEHLLDRKVPWGTAYHRAREAETNQT